MFGCCFASIKAGCDCEVFRDGKPVQRHAEFRDEDDAMSGGESREDGASWHHRMQLQQQRHLLLHWTSTNKRWHQYFLCLALECLLAKLSLLHHFSIGFIIARGIRIYLDHTTFVRIIL